ncbi:unnamed protein product [Staurois parvus]|uniref:Uncharacterized protein n=1 Tax=Staurois parvus TaxID=386267 RepID=A0ABN9AW35_9NEOB|nr:unnamed protein product [Staurois parvus]
MSSVRCRHPSSQVMFPASVRMYGDGTGGRYKKCQIKSDSITLLYQPFHIHFVPYALSCALPAFLLFFLPGN